MNFKIFFIADTHFGHEKSIGYAPISFEEIEQKRAELNK